MRWVGGELIWSQHGCRLQSQLLLDGGEMVVKAEFFVDFQERTMVVRSVFLSTRLCEEDINPSIGG